MRNWVCTVLAVWACAGFSADEVLNTRGQMLKGEASANPGSWKIGNETLPLKDVLYVRLAPDPQPARLDACVFLRGGSMLAGSLGSLIGEQAEVVSSAFGVLKLKRDEVTGAVSPPPSGQPDNLPALSRYANLEAAVLGLPSSTLAPGQVTRVRFAAQDELSAEKLMRVGTEQLMLMTKTKGVETVSRQFVRSLEIATPPAPAASSEDEKLGPEFMVRLKAGDLIRCRVLKLSGNKLQIKTTFAGEKELDRALVAVIFPVGGPNSNVTWLSSLKPARAVHTPYFDAEFPARADASVDGEPLRIGETALERGWGVHSKSELVFELDSAPRMFISLCGMDAETRGRGGVSARVTADGREVWKAEVLTPKDGAKLIAADLGTAKTLSLEVGFGPDQDDSGDHFDWGWAAVVRK